MASLVADTDTPALHVDASINNILDRKHRTPDERLEDLKVYYAFARTDHHAERVAEDAGALVRALLKIVREATSMQMDEAQVETAALLALKGLEVTVLTCPDEEDYTEVCAMGLKAAFESGYTSEAVKAAAIYAFATVIFICTPHMANEHDSNTDSEEHDGDSDDHEEHEDLTSALTLLHEIISTDGESASAPDSAPVVAAAISAYALLISRITHVTTLSDLAEEIADTLLDQLSSPARTVAIPAAEALALLYEKSYRAYDPERDSPEDVPQDPATGEPEAHIKLFEVYRRRDLLLKQLRDLARQAPKRRSKADKKALGEAFGDAAACVERPWLGPRYQPTVRALSGALHNSGAGSDAGSDDETPLDDTRALSMEDSRTTRLEGPASGGGVARRRLFRPAGTYKMKLRVAPPSFKPLDKIPVDSWWMLWRTRMATRVLASGGVVGQWAFGGGERGVVRSLLEEE